MKPWLAGKISGATTVVDLKTDGFPLVGGRIDVVGRTPVPTLVYQRREHQIALSELPERANGAFRSATTRNARWLFDASNGPITGASIWPSPIYPPPNSTLSAPRSVRQPP